MGRPKKSAAEKPAAKKPAAKKAAKKSVERKPIEKKTAKKKASKKRSSKDSDRHEEYSIVGNIEAPKGLEGKTAGKLAGFVDFLKRFF